MWNGSRTALDQVASVLTRAWGQVDSVQPTDTKHMWYSEDRRRSGGLWRQVDHTDDSALVLVVLDLPCISEGTAAQQSARKSDPSKDWEPIAGAYITCVKARGDALASAQASPSEIVDAALADCGAQFVRMRQAITNWFVSAASRSGESAARFRADERTKQTRDDLRRIVISRVIHAREAAAASKAQ
jgi:hypothetical protein